MHYGAGVFRLSGDGDEGGDDLETPWMTLGRVYRLCDDEDDYY